MEKYFEAVGRRKTSVARVRIVKGKGLDTINTKPVEIYFSPKKNRSEIFAPFKAAGIEGEYYFSAIVSGGGINGQLEALRLGISRAIIQMDETLKPALRKAELITRDPRMVERKKYAHRKARKKPQFSKR